MPTKKPPLKKQKITHQPFENVAPQKGAESQLPSINPASPDLRKKYNTTDKLNEHLDKLDISILKALIISGAFPEVCSETDTNPRYKLGPIPNLWISMQAKSDLRHYYKVSNAKDNSGESAIKHFRDILPKRVDNIDRTMCCSKKDNDDLLNGMTTLSTRSANHISTKVNIRERGYSRNYG